MVTEYRHNFAHFQGTIAPPRDNIFEFLLRGTCSAGSNLELGMFGHTVSVDLRI